MSNSISALELKALKVFIHTPVTQDLIHKLVVAALQVLPCQENGIPTPPGSPSDENDKEKKLPSLMTFLTRLVRYTNVYTGTLLATLVYLNRLRHRLPKNARGLPCTRHRILLSCLILSSKFHNDSSPKNSHWAKYTDGLFSVKDVNLMERQLLYLLNWDLKVKNLEMVAQLGRFLAPIQEEIVTTSKMRKFIQEQEKQKMERRLQQKQKDQNQQQQQQRLHPVHISRSSSTCSDLSLHCRQNSASSLSSASSEHTPNVKISRPTINTNPFFKDEVDPLIELTALNEERELTKMLQKLDSSNALAN